MKKLLLSLAGAALLAPAAIAETVTINCKDATGFDGTYVEEVVGDKSTTAAHYQPLNSLMLGDFKLSFTSTNENAASQPAFYYSTTASGKDECTIRVYAETKMTFAAPEGGTITSIKFTGSNAKKLDELSTSTGSTDITSATQSTFTWTGEAEAPEFTFAGAYRIKSVEVTYTTGGTVLPASEAPVFNPASTSFTTPLLVEITAAEGAKIYYTTDGTNPTEESDLYEAPISIATTTTLKAIAVEEGKRASNVTTATYTLEVSYNTLKEFMEAGLADQKSQVKFAGNATVVYQNGKYLFVQDESASMLIFGELKQGETTMTYQPGDVISGFAGKMTVYNNLNELNADASTFAAPVSQVAAPEPVSMKIEDISEADQNKYVVISDVTVVATTTTDDSGKTKTTYKFVDQIDAEIVAYPRFSDVTFPEDDKHYNVTGFVSIFKQDLQIFPVKFDETTGVDEIGVEAGEAEWYNLQGQRVAAPVKGQLLIKVQGGKAQKVIF